MSNRGLESDQERVVGLRRFGDVKLVAGEHVVRASEEIPVQVDGGGGVQSFSMINLKSNLDQGYVGTYLRSPT